MKKISVILSLAMIAIGIYGLVLSGSSTDQGYWMGALIVGVIWLIVDVIAIKRNK